MPAIAVRMNTAGVDGDEFRWRLSRGPAMGETLRVLSPIGIEGALPLLKEHRDMLGEDVRWGEECEGGVMMLVVVPLDVAADPGSCLCARTAGA